MLKKIFLLSVLLLLCFTISNCNNNESKSDDNMDIETSQEQTVTFIELGSVKCIPCKKMQPIMKEIEEEYDDVKVIFYDVWTKEGKPYAQQYGIKLIPTQVFLDKDGKEYFRNEGFFPKDKLIKVLEKGGVNIDKN